MARINVPDIVEVNAQQLEELLDRAASNTLREEDTELLRQIFDSYVHFFELVGDKNTTIARSRKMLFGHSTEKASKLLSDEDADDESPTASADAGNEDDDNEDAGSASLDADGNPDEPPPGHDRTGLFTSGVVATRAGRKIALFFSGRKHAGENLRDVLKHRAAQLEAPIHMCDGLSRNLPKELETILPISNCLSHGRRNFVDLYGRFPEECRHVIKAFKVIYRNDQEARQKGMSAEQRLAFHQAHSKPTMDNLKQWLKRQFDEKLIEPNSALGDAINYLLKRWESLTLFLRKAGAPLDNNVCERALKKAILHRKNALFYKTRRGAQVGDIYMSVIYTCELNGVNAFDYLNQLQANASEVTAAPECWMPWNYRDAVAACKDAQKSS